MGLADPIRPDSAKPVLVVEDSETDAMLLQRQLQLHGVSNPIVILRTGDAAMRFTMIVAHVDHDTCSTALNNAPPLAKLFTRTIGPGASTDVRARRKDAVAAFKRTLKRTGASTTYQHLPAVGGGWSTA